LHTGVEEGELIGEAVLTVEMVATARPGGEHAPAPDADRDAQGGHRTAARQPHALLQAAAK
jgi:hypothetical protein